MNYSKLNLAGSSAPHIRTGSSVQYMMGAVITALLPALGFAVYRFGPQAAVNTLVSIAGCCCVELLCRLAQRKNITAGDLSAAVTGLLLAFMCPVSTPYWLLLAGDFIAIAVVKQLFGGIGGNFLNPALTARVALLLWSGPVDAVSSPTPLALLRQNDLPGLLETYSLPEMFVGLTGGAVGEVSALLLLAGGLFLLNRRVISWRIPAGFLGVTAALAFLLAWGNDRVAWMLCELLNGGLILGAFFIATDPVTSPVSRRGQWIYGAGCGLLTVLLRYYGFCNEGAGFAILLMNLTVRPLDQWLLTGRVDKYALPALPSLPEKTPKA